AAFINKTFSVHGLEQPRLMLAEETVRGLELNVPAEELVKPSPLLMKLGAIMWRASYGDNRSTDMTYDEKQRTIYVGDDPSKDGEFAAQSGVRFQQICSYKRDISWLNVIHQLRISSYDKASV
ncbi:MAG: hypothetical protein ABIV43_00390, partial [Candidatus Saccharimonadales bacterium]